MDFVQPRLGVLFAVGELDGATAPRMAELLWPRLLDEVSAIIIDLGELDFLGAAGLELLASANSYARHRGIGFSVVTGTGAVHRAPGASGIGAELHCSSSVAEATAAHCPAATAP